MFPSKLCVFSCRHVIAQFLLICWFISQKILLNFTLFSFVQGFQVIERYTDVKKLVLFSFV